MVALIVGQEFYIEFWSERPQGMRPLVRLFVGGRMILR
jgi:hypothetical protein